MEFYTFAKDPLLDILIRFFINFVVLFVVIRIIYFTYNRKEEYLFSFFLMGIMIFMVCALLRTVELQMGMALGLFAVFALLRFRTLNLSFKSSAYLFTVIGISVANALFNFLHPIRGVILVNVIIILTVLLLEIYFQKTSLSKHVLIYNNLELLDPDKMEELLRDLTMHLKRKIVRIEIRKIDLNKGNAELEVFFRENPSGLKLKYS